MRKACYIQTSIWADPPFTRLSPDCKLVYLMLLSQPEVGTTGCISITWGRWALKTGFATPDLVSCVGELGLAGFTWDDPSTEELVIRSWVKHNVAGNPKMEKAARDQYPHILSDRLRSHLADEYPEMFTAGEQEERRPGRSTLSAGKRFKVLERDGFKCQYCGRGASEDVELVVDHRQPVSKGGTNNLDNLLTACAECNGAKYDKEPTEKYPIPDSGIPYSDSENRVFLESPGARVACSVVSGASSTEQSALSRKAVAEQSATATANKDDLDESRLRAIGLLLEVATDADKHTRRTFTNLVMKYGLREADVQRAREAVLASSTRTPARYAAGVLREIGKERAA